MPWYLRPWHCGYPVIMMEALPLSSLKSMLITGGPREALVAVSSGYMKQSLEPAAVRYLVSKTTERQLLSSTTLLTRPRAQWDQQAHRDRPARESWPMAGWLSIIACSPCPMHLSEMLVMLIHFPNSARAIWLNHPDVLLCKLGAAWISYLWRCPNELSPSIRATADTAVYWKSFIHKLDVTDAGLLNVSEGELWRHSQLIDVSVRYTKCSTIIEINPSSLR